jgi:hypothetical protein
MQDEIEGESERGDGGHAENSSHGVRKLSLRRCETRDVDGVAVRSANKKLALLSK